MKLMQEYVKIGDIMYLVSQQTEMNVIITNS